MCIKTLGGKFTDAPPFPFQKNLHLHEALHSTGKLVCPECDKTFRRLASFKAHLAVHEEDETVTCEICQEEFVSVVSCSSSSDSVIM